MRLNTARRASLIGCVESIFIPLLSTPSLIATEPDRIFTEFTGNFVPGTDGNGTNVIAGGAGKYTGITGSGPWKCKPSGTNGEVQCAQRLDYKLP